MKASLYVGNHTLEFRETPDLKPAKDEVLLQIKYCGICGSDLHLLHGAMDYRLENIPHIAGHEFLGIITEVGEETKTFKVGDRVTAWPLESCNECIACKNGHPNVCSNLRIYGIETQGAFAEYYKIPEHALFHVPDEISDLHASLIEPVTVAAHAVNLAELKAGQTAVVIGAGPIGVLTALVAKAKGIKVIVSEVSKKRLLLVEELGLSGVDPTEVDLQKYVFEATEGNGADVVFDAAGVQVAIDTAPTLTHPRSKIVIVAAYQKPVNFPMRDLYMKEVSLLTSRCYTKEDLAEAIEIVASGAIPCDKIITKVMPLSEAQAAFELAAKGEDVCKVVLDCTC